MFNNYSQEQLRSALHTLAGNVRPTLTKFGQSWACLEKCGSHRRSIARVRPSLAQLGQPTHRSDPDKNEYEFGRPRPKYGRNRAKPGRVQHDFWPLTSQILSNPQPRIWPNATPHWSSSTKAWPKPSQIVLSTTQTQTRANPTRMRECGRTQREFGGARPQHGRRQHDVGRSRLKFGQVQPIPIDPTKHVVEPALKVVERDPDLIASNLNAADPNPHLVEGTSCVCFCTRL